MKSSQCATHRDQPFWSLTWRGECSLNVDSLNPVFEMKVLDPRIHEWGLPRFQTAQSAGIDLYACIDEPLTLQPQAEPILISSGIAILMNDPNMVAFLLARSGLGHKKGLVLGQAVGTIDADYADQIFISAWLRNPPGSAPLVINPGDRIAQLVFLPVVRPSFRVVEAFSAATARGRGGFGSTGI
ncbi:dUTP diphosphatase [Bosea sp. (in: a-proteobacteria)]|uniref:dUTP diphosphatase n=1 Tax=Bosea sp. (in: a-proteobacteria) TaxID=1871050 RepID=UPI00273335FD|nr:dUTP diphosphatase [Bosea sp. (in: a-proteobacteria)]MDP3407392.1 dUTP diphosphatase [Bosea sp. (in: a-proteobacteria)]